MWDQSRLIETSLTRRTCVIGINGAAAHLVEPGDLVILISYAMLTGAEARELNPQVVHVDGDNRIVDTGIDAARPVGGASDQIAGTTLADTTG